jgi:hypothetical protein
VIEHEREHDSKSNTDRFIVSRYGQNVDEEEDDARCGFVMVVDDNGASRCLVSNRPAKLQFSSTVWEVKK